MNLVDVARWLVNEHESGHAAYPARELAAANEQLTPNSPPTTKTRRFRRSDRCLSHTSTGNTN
jgi:hypothetical protein